MSKMLDINEWISAVIVGIAFWLFFKAVIAINKAAAPGKEAERQERELRRLKRQTRRESRLRHWGLYDD